MEATRRKNKKLSHINNKYVDSDINSKLNPPKKKKNGRGLYYSCLTGILVCCLIQITISAVINISKIISYKTKIYQMQRSYDMALSTHDQLNDSIKNFSKASSLEAIARNNLKLASNDEVLVIINPNKDEKDSKAKKKSLIHYHK